ncbi:helix-turn-helix domain-containing protein [Asticcacaulis sp. W401b]|uniref:helix-turn-helix domain-containing protein n=1 Tax=Asticcacaulis sp. W401b TaxID=3388666 RepID=UPI003970FBAA
MASDEERIHPVDRHVGGRVRMRRKFVGKSQADMADSIGLTFQQVQKYERGANRISASKLFEISCFLKVPVGYFYEGLGEEGQAGFSESTTEQLIHGFLMSTEGIELAEVFPRVRNLKHRKRILDLVRALAEEDD